jgi:hypothetical protein
VVLWFVAAAVASVWMVFRDPRFDYRPLIVGALLPDIVDVWTTDVKPLHSVTVAMGGLVVIMLATIGRRRLRKILLAVPIGMMLHLVFDGAFADTDVFWWPLTGASGTAEIPAVERGWWNLALEAAGAGVIALGISRFGLRERTRRRQFLATGHLTPSNSGAENFSRNRV